MRDLFEKQLGRKRHLLHILPCLLRQVQVSLDYLVPVFEHLELALFLIVAAGDLVKVLSTPSAYELLPHGPEIERLERSILIPAHDFLTVAQCLLPGTMLLQAEQCLAHDARLVN